MSWKINIGIIRGNDFMTRDNNYTRLKFSSDEPLESLEDCIQCVHDWRQNYRRFRYRINYAVAVDPNGEQHKIV